MAAEFPDNFFAMRLEGGSRCDFAFVGAARWWWKEAWLEEVTDNWVETIQIGESSSVAAAEAGGASGDGKKFQPTFLFTFVVFFACFMAAWALWHLVAWGHACRVRREREQRLQQGDEAEANGEDEEGETAKCRSALDLWLLLLTRYPLPFLLISLAIPLIFSWRGFEASGRSVELNLDFETYLDINTP